MDTSSSSDEPSPSSTDLDSETSSEHPQEGVRQQRRAAKRKRYLSGKSRKVYQLHRELDKSLDSLLCYLEFVRPVLQHWSKLLKGSNIMVQNLT